MEQLGVAIIGSGGISEGHGESFSRLNDKVKVMAFTDVDISRAKFRAEQFHAPIAATDYSNLLQRDDIHIISICSPPFLHLQTIKDSLQAEKHVLCEKPVVMNLAELDEIEKQVQESGLCFGGAFQWRFGTGVQQLKDLYDNGMFGKIIYATNNLFWHRTQDYFDVDWRHSWDKAGGGIIFNLACHGLDALLWILGDISHVCAEMDTLKFNMEIEDTGSAILRFKNGALGAVNATVNAHYQRSHLEIIGTKLEAISSDDPYGVAYQPWQFRSMDPEYEKQVQEFLSNQNYEFEPASHRRLVKDFVEAIFEQRQPAVDIREIRRSLEVLTAIYKSNRMGKRVELPLEKEDDFYFSLNP
ncbi:MAG: Gfo/Idh/MocA family oxidoreductase [bacterium]|nr:MAG: Gfo/Idh/MocA family oxidoreductase [bacterium]